MDKSSEHSILSLVYAPPDLGEVAAQENPDFLCIGHNGFKFGVEVTELYLSESSARLRCIPGYLSQLFRERKYRGKADEETIPVSRAVFRNNQTGSELQVDSAIGVFFTLKDGVSRLKDSIAKKNDRVPDYLKCCDAVDLIVSDVDRISRCVDVEELLIAIEDAGADVLIRNSGFREIYLVSAVDGQAACVPLRANYFMAEAHAFHLLSGEYYRDRSKSIQMREYLNGMGHFLCKRMKGIEVAVDDEGYLRFGCASVEFRFGSQNQMQIFEAKTVRTKNRSSLELELLPDTLTELAEFIEHERCNATYCVPIISPLEIDPFQSFGIL